MSKVAEADLLSSELRILLTVSGCNFLVRDSVSNCTMCAIVIGVSSSVKPLGKVPASSSNAATVCSLGAPRGSSLALANAATSVALVAFFLSGSLFSLMSVHSMAHAK